MERRNTRMQLICTSCAIRLCRTHLRSFFSGFSQSFYCIGLLFLPPVNSWVCNKFPLNTIKAHYICIIGWYLGEECGAMRFKAKGRWRNNSCCNLQLLISFQSRAKLKTSLSIRSSS